MTSGAKSGQVVPILGIWFNTQAGPTKLAFQRKRVGKRSGIVGCQVDEIALGFVTQQSCNDFVLTSLRKPMLLLLLCRLIRHSSGSIGTDKHMNAVPPIAPKSNGLLFLRYIQSLVILLCETVAQQVILYILRRRQQPTVLLTGATVGQQRGVEMSTAESNSKDYPYLRSSSDF